MTCRLQVHLNAKDLKNVSGLLGVSDPFCIVVARGDNPDNPPDIVGNTEVCFNNLNPGWNKGVLLDGYKFGLPYYVEVGVFDFDSSATGKTERDLDCMDSITQQQIIQRSASKLSELMCIGEGSDNDDNSKMSSVASMSTAILNFASKKNKKNSFFRRRQGSMGRQGSFAGRSLSGSDHFKTDDHSDVVDDSTDDSFPHVVMGTALFEVGEILGKRGNTMSKKLQNKAGTLTIHIDKARNIDQSQTPTCYFQLCAKNLINMNALRKSSPYYQMYQKVESATGQANWISVYRSNVVKHCLNPTWNESVLDLGITCNCDLDRSIKLIVRDHRLNGKSKLMGEFETTMRAFIEAADSKSGGNKNNTKKDSDDDADNDENHFILMKNNEKIVGSIQVLHADVDPAILSMLSLPPSSDLKNGHQRNRQRSRPQLLPRKIKQAVRQKSAKSGREPIVPQEEGNEQQPQRNKMDTVLSNNSGSSTKRTNKGKDDKKGENTQNAKPPTRKASSNMRGMRGATTRSKINKQKRKDNENDDEISSSHSQGDAPLPSQQQQQHYHQIQPAPEFVDYLSFGCQISLAVAIDFTASNGDPRQPGTPHYFHPANSNEWNDYEKAIFAVGSILAKYDSDQKFPVWGFGAKYDNIVQHCFQCGAEVEVDGVQGIMDAYRGVFRTPLTMSYPNDFTEVIETAASYAEFAEDNASEGRQLSYTILLILTSGNIENSTETKNQLLEVSKNSPLSIVIVGIGDIENFESMAFLDDHDPTKEDGRDITKFVKFRDYKSYNALTEAVLDEIPTQLVDYFHKLKGIKPDGGFDIDNDAAGDYSTSIIEEADDDSRACTFFNG